jgi:hypothetical protein
VFWQIQKKLEVKIETITFSDGQKVDSHFLNKKGGVSFENTTKMDLVHGAYNNYFLFLGGHTIQIVPWTTPSMRP